jgi:hypothetical protein
MALNELANRQGLTEESIRVANGTLVRLLDLGTPLRPNLEA